MAKLVWDQVGERLYETGVKNVVLYRQTTAGVYGTGVAWNGVTSISQNPTGADSNPVYADDIKYLDIRSVEEEEGSITAYTYPDEWEECDGSATLATGVVVHQQPRKPFGLYENHGYKLQLIYGATASPSEKTHDTINDSPEAVEMSWDFTTVPVAILDNDGHPVAGFKPTSSIEIDSTKVDATKLAALEDILYGSDGTGTGTGTTARLPLPYEVMTTLS